MAPGLRFFIAFVLLSFVAEPTPAAQSVARKWNEVMLQAIRKDFARPTVQARNLFHFAMAVYDSWAAYDSVATPYFLNHHLRDFVCPFNGAPAPANIQAAREEAISYAAYRLLRFRYQYSPGAAQSRARFDSLMVALGYDTTFTSTDYASGSPGALGNYIAQGVIDYGLQDGSNEQNGYAYQHYSPVNPPLIVARPGNSSLVDPNRWQPLALTHFIDQNGHPIPGTTPPFLTPEWGAVTPFALSDDDRTTYTREGFDYQVYHDPGPPPYIDPLDSTNPSSELYKWGFELVAMWSSHLKAADGVMVDISPGSIGNATLPQTAAELQGFYNLFEGGDTGTGRSLNPRTGLPYTPQYVPRGDYTRVLAEFWADGPSSETPPGHWFTILNYVSDHPAVVKRFEGKGPLLDDLQWDVKAYFVLGGAVHDAAIACWGAKGWYDYIRPISAIRWMADRGQSSDSTVARYDPAGLPLIPGFVELVQPGDPLAGPSNGNVGKIKLLAWRGPDYITDPATQVADVGWILAEKWMPYQRPTFVTPPFAGYFSGHSTYSRASAEVMTRLTGDEYFPGGMSEFFAPRNQFLVFEDGPSVDVTLQWATYRDASDQCSLSRIWGGIHPPQDDIPGRLIGRTIGQSAFDLAQSFFTPTIAMAFDITPNTLNLTSHGLWVTGFFEPASPFAASDIDIASIRLSGTVPVDPAAPTAFADHNGNGVPDLMVKFNRAAVELTLSEGDNIPVIVTGTIGDWSFLGTDSIRVRRAVVSAPMAGSHLTARSVAQVRWQTPSEVTVESVALLQSFDGGNTWSLIARGQPNTGSYDWTVPNVQADHAKVAVVLAVSADETGGIVDGVLGVSAEFSIDAMVGVGDAEPIQFALRGVIPNPAQHELRVSFSLKDSKAATLALFDVSGRQLAARRVDGMGPGWHAVTLGGRSNLPAGLYVIRLTQDGRNLTTRAALVR